MYINFILQKHTDNFYIFFVTTWYASGAILGLATVIFLYTHVQSRIDEKCETLRLIDFSKVTRSTSAFTNFFCVSRQRKIGRSHTLDNLFCSFFNIFTRKGHIQFSTPRFWFRLFHGVQTLYKWWGGFERHAFYNILHLIPAMLVCTKSTLHIHS